MEHIILCSISFHIYIHVLLLKVNKCLIWYLDNVHIIHIKRIIIKIEFILYFNVFLEYIMLTNNIKRNRIEIFLIFKYYILNLFLYFFYKNQNKRFSKFHCLNFNFKFQITHHQNYQAFSLTIITQTNNAHIRINNECYQLIE